MGKIALLVSREEMLYQAHNILQEKKYKIEEMRAIQTSDTVVEARNTIAGGASIIIARGLQASLIKQYTDIPVVEIVLTAQEMALLIVKAKQIIKKEKPCIAVVGFENMFCDMSYFEDIYGIELRTYYSLQGNQLKQTALEAVDDQVDLIIGGDTAVAAANEAGIPSLFLSTTEDSLRNAFSMAESMDYAMSVEKKNAAQMETLLDYSFDGVINLDASGKIRGVNALMQELLGETEEDLLRKKVSDIFMDISEDILKQVLVAGNEHSLFVQANHISMFAIIIPILLDDRVDGAILTCRKMKKRKTAQRPKERENTSTRLVTPGDFQDLIQESKNMLGCIQQAKLYTLSDRPIVIIGEAGTERLLLAQSIHNNSLRNQGSFLNISCDGANESEGMSLLFGDKGALSRLDEGTLVIEDPDQMSRDNQYCLYQLISNKYHWEKNFTQKRHLDIRIIVITNQPLERLVMQKILREDLYYLLSGLVLKVPPLRERKEDLKKKLEFSIKENCEHYGRYHVLTNTAKQVLLDYAWPGNLIQVDNFCERLILTAKKRSVDENVVLELLEELYPTMVQEEETADHKKVVSEKEEQIRRTLLTFDGNREETARSLGISKATLWRYMKKYNIQ